MVQGKAWMCSHPPGLCGCLVHCGEGISLPFVSEKGLFNPPFPLSLLTPSTPSTAQMCPYPLCPLQ